MRDLRKNQYKHCFRNSTGKVHRFLMHFTMIKDLKYRVITNEDKPVGRNKYLLFKGKEFATKNHIEVYHTNSNTEKYKEA
jgi:methionyl-tRNA formyltransferase